MKFEHADSLSNRREQEDFDTYLKLSFTRRVLLAVVLVFAGISALASRMFYLQIRRYDYYRTRAQSNRIRVKPLNPERGMIYDRNGIALTENILRYQVVVNPSQTENVQALLDAVRLILPLSDEECNTFLQRYRATRRYENAVLKDSITEDERYKLAVQLYRLPGLLIESYYERYYPYGALCAHIVGYTNRINEKDLQSINQEAYRGIRFIGRAGIERQYEEKLRGKPGFQQVETDANGNLVRLLNEVPAERGQDIYLSLDLNLQRFIYHLLEDYRGSSVVLDVETGEVLAMVSKPGFDANLFTRGITQKQYQNLLDDPYAPLYDRALKGRYPPGSVVKPMMYLAGLHYGVLNSETHINCTGAWGVPDAKTARQFHCWNRSGHGALNGYQAITQSCDIYFYTLGYRLGIDKMAEYCQYFSIGKLTGIDLPDEDSGLMPSRAWKEKKYKTNWYIGDTVNTSIGQGFLTTTPLQLAYMTTLIARNGRQFTPQLLRRVYNPVKMQFFDVPRASNDTETIYSQDAWQLVKTAMEAVIHSPTGTAHGIAKDLKYRMAGKSGTVQVISFKTDKRIPSHQLAKEYQDNAMFVAYAPAQTPKIAVSMVVERGGGGSHTAAPLVRQITDYYLLGQPQMEQTNAHA